MNIEEMKCKVIDEIFSGNLKKEQVPLYSLPPGLRKIAEQEMMEQRPFQQLYGNECINYDLDWNSTIRGNQFWLTVWSYYHTNYHSTIEYSEESFLTALHEVGGNTMEQLKNLIDFNLPYEKESNTIEKALYEKFNILK